MGSVAGVVYFGFRSLPRKLARMSRAFLCGVTSVEHVHPVFPYSLLKFDFKVFSAVGVNRLILLFVNKMYMQFT